IFYVAIPVGSALGFVLGGLLEHSIGWRQAFLLTGAPGLLLAAIVLLNGEPPRATESAKRESEPAKAIGYASLARIRAYRESVLGYAAYTFALGGFAAWAPKYLYSELGMDLKTADFWFGAILVLTGLVATFLGAELAARTPGKDVVHANQRLCAITI